MAFSFSTPSFQNPQTQQQLFNQQSNPFSSFSQPQQQQQQQQQPFQLQQQQQPFQLQQQQQQQQPQQQQIYLYTLDKSPASYSTKWADLHPESQKLLLQIEERILEYKDESQRLDQCTRLYDSSISNDSFELVTNHIIQDLGSASAVMEREKVPLKALTNEVKNMMWHTEKAIRSYMMLRPRFLHQNSSTISNNATTGQPTNVSQQNTSTIAPMYDFYSGLPKRPSPFIQQTVERFEKYLAECCQWIKELEQLVQIDSYKSSSDSGLQSLPNVMSNVHDYFVYVAAKVENLHQYIESLKAAYLADQRRRGEENNPFLEADRRETAKQEAAARRIHPTLHLAAYNASNSTPALQSSHGAGLFASSAQPLSSSSAQPQPMASPFSSGGGGLSLFSTPAASTPSLSLFSTPVTSNPASNLFATPAYNTPTTSLFGTSLASTSVGGNSLFSTPLNTGSLTGLGASFGAASKSSRPKARTARR